jgi:hypothetical protein
MTMKRIALTLMALSAFALTACEGTSDSLTDGRRGDPRNPNTTAGGADNTFDHSNDPGGPAPGADFQPAEPAQQRLIGSPEVTSRLHSCGKLTYASLGALLQSRGLTGRGGGRPQGIQSSQQIYNGASSALGTANYNGRVAEATFASTSAMSKMFDIFAMASYDAVADNFEAEACPDTQILGADGKFTRDGLSCLMGKPALDEHLAIANDAIAKNSEDGAKIAILALLSAAHTCQ